MRAQDIPQMLSSRRLCIAQYTKPVKRDCLPMSSDLLPSPIDPDDPTFETYQLFQKAMVTLNLALFDGQLPPTLVTLQRKPRTIGYFSPARFGNLKGRTVDEIALNPSYFSVLSPLFLLSVIAHEQVHQWQEHFGHPVRPRYHDKQWAQKMESIGLMPSSTGKPGGRRVGQQMAHYVMPEGPFIEVATQIIESPGFAVPWLDRYPAKVAADDAPGEMDQPSLASSIGSAASAVVIEGEPVDDSMLPWNGPYETTEEHPDYSPQLSNIPISTDPPDDAKTVARPETRPRLGSSIEFVTDGLAEKVGDDSLVSPAAQGFAPAERPQQDGPKKTDASNRVKYNCSSCRMNVWGKPDLRISCMDCDRPLRSIRPT